MGRVEDTERRRSGRAGRRRRPSQEGLRDAEGASGPPEAPWRLSALMSRFSRDLSQHQTQLKWPATQHQTAG